MFLWFCYPSTSRGQIKNNEDLLWDRNLKPHHQGTQQTNKLDKNQMYDLLVEHWKYTKKIL